ncbi:putative nuclease HARBI1 [Colias croceus]|uniref:putative nuclease HARBI1 n=1 Tax=Colias crocea TaxID=72248 RepID=UPI001E279F0B|nr:putative nuclease HARBI1 [Colias croceus]
MPCTAQELADTKQKFYEIARFPNVIGAIDCTHVKIESPGGNEPELFRNRKNFFSMNVQAICNAELKFTNVVARWPGSVHDARIFANSSIKKSFEDGIFANSLLLGDSGYPISNYCVIPIHQPTTDRENIYNEAQIRTRNCIERAFGVLKRRFPVLSLGIRLDIKKVQCICVVSAILHNIAIDFNEPEPPHLPEEIEAAVTFGNEVPVDTINQDNNMGVMTNLLRYFENLN